MHLAFNGLTTLRQAQGDNFIALKLVFQNLLGVGPMGKGLVRSRRVIASQNRWKNQFVGLYAWSMELTRERLKFGREGESAALTFLKKKGYRILEKNFRSKVGEIDIVAEQDGVIVFVEVKARADHEFGHPFNALTPAKQRKIIQTAQTFLAQKRLSDKNMRFDVVALTSDAESSDSWKIELLQNAF